MQEMVSNNRDVIKSIIKAELLILMEKISGDFIRNYKRKINNWTLADFDSVLVAHMVFVSSFESKSGNMFQTIARNIAKIKYGGKKDDLKWAVESAGRTKVVIAGGVKKNEKDFLKDVKNIMDSGAIGVAVGRNVWQSKDPLGITKKIKKIIWEN